MSLRRERHESDIANIDTNDPAKQIPVQISVEYSDGGGNVLVKKVQAEPDPTIKGGPVRWIGSGKTVLNNKGKPVKQYEPYWSGTLHRFDANEAQQEVGPTRVIYYDAVGRVVRTDLPDGSFSRADFSPWFSRQFDANDTVLDSAWYSDRGSPGILGVEPADPDQRAAWLATVHSNTPAQTHTDSLGRTVIAIVHNRVRDANGTLTYAGAQWRDEKYLSFTKLDTEGKALWVRDALGNLVTQSITPLKATRWADDPTEDVPPKCVTGYDIAGNVLFQHSMDAGDRYVLTDGAAQPMFAWDRNERQVGAHTAAEDRRLAVTYDALHRPLTRTLALNGGAALTLERLEYSNARTPDGSANAQLAADKAANLLGQLVRQYDGSGLAATIRRDYQGNVLESQRRLNNQPTQSLIDWSGDPQPLLLAETFQRLSEFDALNRPVRIYNWRRMTLDRVGVLEAQYNQRGLLSSQQFLVRAQKTAAGYNVIGETTTTNAITAIHYNLKGQTEYLSLGNGTLAQYDYDPNLFRLAQIRTTRPPRAGDFPAARALLSDPGVVQQLLYTFDAVGNITETNDQAFEPVFFQNQQVVARSRYEYDALYRLTLGSGRENGALRGVPVNLDGAAISPGFPIAATDPNALRNYVETLVYDAAGNIRELQHQAGSLGSWTRDYSYAFDDPTQPASNRLWQTWTGGDRTNAITYAHDTHGNLLNLANSAPNYNMAWDPSDMISSVDLGGGGSAFYQYGASKQRSRKQIVRNGGTTEERIYLDGFELFRRTSAGRTVEEIESHHLMLGDRRVLLVDDVLTAADAEHPRADGLTVTAQTLLRYQYSNHLDTAGLELDGNAAIISYEEFHSYGTSAYRAVDSAVEAAPKRYRFTGMERDEESGLSYQSARYFFPCLGRWVSSDPSGTRDGLNLYAYCRGNPVGLRDPGGDAAAPLVDAGTDQDRVVPLDTDVSGTPLKVAPELVNSGSPTYAMEGGGFGTIPSSDAGTAAETPRPSYYGPASLATGKWSAAAKGALSGSTGKTRTNDTGIFSEKRKPAKVSLSAGVEWSAFEYSNALTDHHYESYDVANESGTWSSDSSGKYNASLFKAGLSTSGVQLSLMDLAFVGSQDSAGMLLGNWVGGLTVETVGKTGLANLDVGVKDWEVQVNAGVGLSSRRLSIGVNVLGGNVSGFGEARLGQKWGLEIGKTTAVHGAFFSVGVELGTAKGDKPDLGVIFPTSQKDWEAAYWYSGFGLWP
jgi:RHS repeat-associated protein